ncbi:MAG TPA: 50S ribosomal protein L31 [Oculatellaceae cyanobacterium]|jgi:large subunit ribosomal protein L31
MRQDIHPEYHKVSAVCVCGGVIETGSILPEIRLDICSNCHPFYTGTQKIVDTEGRVEKFKKRFANAGAKSSKKGKAASEQQ